MLTYLVSSLGIEESPYFAIFLIAILGMILGRHLKLSICAIISIATLATSLYMLITFEELTKLIGFVDLFFSIVLSLSMWVTVLVTSRHNPEFRNLIQKLKTSILR